jgi:outer membrane protein assembly factor BamB
VTALATKNGEKIWSRPVRISAVPAARNLVVRNGRVFVSEVDSVLAMDVTDGHTIWKFHPSTQAVVFASVDDRALYTGQRDTPIVYALDFSDGHVLWQNNVGSAWTYPGHITGTAVSGDTVYVAARKWLAQNGYIGQGVLVALDRKDGHELWRYETPGTNGGLEDAPVVAGRLVVVSDLIGNGFFAFDRFAKALAWRVQGSDNGPLTPPVVVDDQVFVGSANGHLYAADLKTGVVQWDQNLVNYIGGTVYCAQQVFVQAMMIQRRDPARGGAYSGAFQYEPQTGPYTSNLVADGQNIYFTGENGIYAVSCK